MFNNLTMDPPEGPCSLHAAQQLTMEIFGTGAPRPPKQCCEDNKADGPKMFFEVNEVLFSFPTLFWGEGEGGGVSIVKLLSRVCAISVDVLFRSH